MKKLIAGFIKLLRPQPFPDNAILLIGIGADYARTTGLGFRHCLVCRLVARHPAAVAFWDGALAYHLGEHVYAQAKKAHKESGAKTSF